MSNPEFGIPINPVTETLQRAAKQEKSGQWSDANTSYEAAVAIDPSPESRIAYSHSLATREQYNDAICQLTSALDVASASGDRRALGIIFHNLAAIYRELGDPDLARRFQQRAIQQMDDCGPEELLGLANDAWLSRRTELAECLATGSAELDDDEVNSISLEAQALLGVISGLTDNPREAIRSLMHVYRQHRVAGELRMMGIDLLNLSVLFGEVGRHQTELMLVRQAIVHFEKAPAPISAGKARQVLTSLERMQSLRDFDPSVN